MIIKMTETVHLVSGSLLEDCIYDTDKSDFLTVGQAKTLLANCNAIEIKNGGVSDAIQEQPRIAKISKGKSSRKGTNNVEKNS